MAKINQPKFNDLPAKHIRKGRGKILGLVLHDTAGSGTHNDTLYLAKPGDGRVVSCDFTVERNGSIWKLNPDLNKFYCLHAGRATKFKGLRNGDVTRTTIGIEICQHYDPKKVIYTPEQVEAVAHLCAWLCQEFKLSSQDITTHRNIIQDASRSDPRYFPFDDFWLRYWRALGKGDEYAASLETRKTGQG
jgi:N-acetyl-anhydromuramyl-L-alanine amidase AmpD